MSSIFLKKWEKKKNKGKDSAKKRLGDLFSSERWQAPETFCGGTESIEVKNLIQVCNNDYFTCGLGDVRLVCSELSHSLAVVLWWGNLIVSGTEEGRWILYQVPVENFELMSGTEKVLLKDEKRNCPKQLSCPACNTTTSKYLQHTKWRRRITISSVLLNSQQKSCPVEHWRSRIMLIFRVF